MMVKTLNDLSEDEVRLDYETMLDVTRSAYAYALEHIYMKQARLNTYPIKEGNSMRNILAEGLVDDAIRLSKAANMLATLEEGQTRRNVTIANHTILVSGEFKEE